MKTLLLLLIRLAREQIILQLFLHKRQLLRKPNPSVAIHFSIKRTNTWLEITWVLKMISTEMTNKKMQKLQKTESKVSLVGVTLMISGMLDITTLECGDASYLFKTFFGKFRTWLIQQAKFRSTWTLATQLFARLVRSF